MTDTLEFESNDVMLLTGAGFSANFGCPLAQEMWSWIFNQKVIQNLPRAKELLKDNFDFESAIYEILNGAYSSEEKTGIVTATQTAFQKIDETIKRWRSPNSLNVYGLEKLLTKFSGNRHAKTKGIIFTLNQDLLLERHYINFATYGSPHCTHQPILLGLKQNQNWFKGATSLSANGDFSVNVPENGVFEKDVLEQLQQNCFFYIKLHGSQNWFRDGQQKMVIGGGKKEIIENEPILKKYYDIFRKVVCQGNRKLLIIGYGFRDQHINEPIIEAIEKHGLKIYIISPQTPEEWKNQGVQLKSNSGHSASVCRSRSNYVFPLVWEGLGGYFPWDFKRIFPPDQSVTEEYKQIMSALFQQ